MHDEKQPISHLTGGETDNPVLSVIVPVWNRPDDIRRCLTSLVSQSLDQSEYEIIVADNGSSDDTATVAESFEAATVVCEPTPGSYAARNKAISVARGQYLAFTDSDCTADPRWLEAGLRALRAQPDVGLVAGKIELSREGGGTLSICEAHERVFAFNQEKNVRNGKAVTANWFSPASLVRDLQGFRSDLKSGGDFELARRIAAAGRPVVYAPDAVVIHPARASLAELIAKRRRVIGGRMTATKAGPVRSLWNQILDTLRRFKALAASNAVGPGMKVLLVGLLSLLLVYSLVEVVRLSLGAQPTRA